MAVNINDSGSMRNAILNRKAEILNFVDFINGSFDRIRRDLLHKSVLQDIGSIARDTYAHIIEEVGKRGTEVRLTGSQGKYLLALYSPASQLPRVPKHVDRSGLYRSGLATTGNFADPRFIETPFKGAARTDTNVFYRKSALPNELFNFPLATMEQAEQMREEDARTQAQKDKWSRVDELIRKNAHKRVIEGIERNRENAEYYEDWAYQGRRYKRRQQSEAFKEFRWLKPIARNIPLIGKNLPAISKALHTAARTPGIGGLVRHPIVAGAGAVGLVANYYLGKMQRNAQLGAISDVLGMPLSRLRSAGHVLSAWGGSEKDLASAMSSFGTAQGKMFMGLGGTEHLEQLAMAGIDIRGSGKGGLLTMNEKIQRVSEAIRKAYASGDQDKVLALASIGGFSSAMTEAAIRGEDLSQYEGLFGLTATESGRMRGEAANRRKNSFWTEMLSYVFGNYTGGSSVGAMNFGSTQTGASTQAVASTQASRKHRYLIKTNGVEREMTPEEIKDFEERKAEWKEEADQKRAEHWARIEKSEAYKKAMSAYVQGDSAAVSASQYLANGNGGVNGNITVQIGTLQTDAKNYKDLMTDIATVGITDPSTRKAIIDSFDTLGE